MIYAHNNNTIQLIFGIALLPRTCMALKSNDNRAVQWFVLAALWSVSAGNITFQSVQHCMINIPCAWCGPSTTDFRVTGGWLERRKPHSALSEIRLFTLFGKKQDGDDFGAEGWITEILPGILEDYIQSKGHF